MNGFRNSGPSTQKDGATSAMNGTEFLRFVVIFMRVYAIVDFKTLFNLSKPRDSCHEV